MCPSRFFPDYDDDIFFSYAHYDNQDVYDDHKGWVDALHEKLETRITQLLGVKPEIWRDPELRCNDYLSDTIVVRLQKAVLLVSVLSPSYIESKSCRQELEEFYRRASENGGIRVNNKSRIFKVIKTPVKRELHPPELRDLFEYEFYAKDRKTGEEWEFSHVKGLDGYSDFIKGVQRLAISIKLFIEQMRDTVPSGKTVYVAETISGLKDEYQKIKSELEQRGHRVVPDKRLPTDGAECIKAIQEYLSQSQISIHLVGATPGFTPENESRDIVRLQHDLALGQELDSSLFRFVWMPMGIRVRNKQQRKFINYLRTDERVQLNAELLLGNTIFEDLKRPVLSKLESLKSEEVHGFENPEPTEGVRIYLICDKRDFDADAFVPLHNYLYERGYEVTLPLMTGEEEDVNRENEKNLMECDVAIIFYGMANEIWMRQQLRDLLQANGGQRTKPSPLKAIYITEPMDKQKEIYRTHEALVIKNRGNFSEAPLAELLAKIEEKVLPKVKVKGTGT